MEHGDAQSYGLAGSDLLAESHGQVVEEGGRRKDGVPGHIGPGAVSPLALEVYHGANGAGHPGTGVHAHLPLFQLGIDMDTPAHIHIVLVQCRQQGLDAGTLLLPFLKAEEDGAAELVLQLGQDLQRPQQHGHMGVMAASVAVAVMLGPANPGAGQVLL